MTKKLISALLICVFLCLGDKSMQRSPANSFKHALIKLYWYPVFAWIHRKWVRRRVAICRLCQVANGIIYRYSSCGRLTTCLFKDLEPPYPSQKICFVDYAPGVAALPCRFTCFLTDGYINIIIIRYACTIQRFSKYFFRFIRGSCVGSIACIGM